MAAISSIVIGGAIAAGSAVSAYGTYTQMKASKSANAFQQAQIAEEQKQERIRQQAMELEARRRQIEIIRQRQRASALSLATATAQGASGGSGLQGGQAQIAGQTNWNLLGINQNLGFGQQMFASNALISQARMGYAGAQTQASMGAGISSLGGTLTGLAGTAGNLFGGFGGNRGFSGPETYANTRNPYFSPAPFA